MSKPQYRIPDELDDAIGKLVDMGLFPSKQAFVTVAVGKMAMEYGIIKVKDTKEKGTEK
ncbi:MAG TPA: hypothetical protein VMT57_02665 [Candidatus Thermoplasmatota archaeon]|nr:hypothetical protein [Candidatus Thermoplasmatota archaeon]